MFKTKFWSPTWSVQKNFVQWIWPKNISSWKIAGPRDFFLVQISFDSKFMIQKTFWTKTIFGLTFFYVEIILGQNIFDSKESLRQQNFESKEILNKKKIGSRQFCLQTMVGLLNFGSIKIKACKNMGQNVWSKFGQ